MVIDRSAGTVSIGPCPARTRSFSTATRRLPSCGRNRSTGSASPRRPSSHSNSPATPVTGLVIDAMANSASSGIGALRSGPRWPTASWNTRRPCRATATTAPGNWPASISAFSAGTIRPSRADDMPTASGSARGRVCWFAVAAVISLLPVPPVRIPESAASVSDEAGPVNRDGNLLVLPRRDLRGSAREGPTIPV